MNDVLTKVAPVALLAVTFGIGEARAACTDAQYRAIEAKVATGDGKGHGPDVGSDEWKSTVEFRLGVRGKPGVPARDSGAWCSYIERLASARAAGGSSASPAADAAAVPAGTSSPAKGR